MTVEDALALIDDLVSAARREERAHWERQPDELLAAQRDHERAHLAVMSAVTELADDETTHTRRPR